MSGLEAQGRDVEISREGRVEKEEEDSVGRGKSRKGEREKKEEAGRKVSACV